MRATLTFLVALACATPAFAQGTWEPSPEQVEQATDAVDHYFSALEHGEFDRAFNMMARITRALESQRAFAERQRKFTSASGALIERRFHRVTWYKDPAGAPAPGVYVAFDMVAWFANLDHYCGYAMAYQPPEGGAFEIIRIDETTMDRQTAGAGEQSKVVWRQVAGQACPGWTEQIGSR